MRFSALGGGVGGDVWIEVAIRAAEEAEMEEEVLAAFIWKGRK
jgi:hypothetical protein